MPPYRGVAKSYIFFLAKKCMFPLIWTFQGIWNIYYNISIFAEMKEIIFDKNLIYMNSGNKKILTVASVAETYENIELHMATNAWYCQTMEQIKYFCSECFFLWCASLLCRMHIDFFPCLLGLEIRNMECLVLTVVVSIIYQRVKHS